MCTISWSIEEEGYSVFFNRDESILRPKAIPPTIHSLSHARGIFPVDPQGGGTWLAVNECGVTIGLLNFYQGRLPKGRLISRGQIVKACAEKANVAEVVALVKSLNLKKYAPFSLLIFAPQYPQRNTENHCSGQGGEMLLVSPKRNVLGDSNRGSVTMLQWCGKELNETGQKSPLISSAIELEAVRESRLSAYRRLIPSSEDCRSEERELLHRRLHTSHSPDKSAFSICMHREDARTVSFSHVKVGAKTIEFFYSDGAPCETTLRLCASMQRT